MLTPTVLRTWAPRGQTPLLRHWQRHWLRLESFPAYAPELNPDEQVWGLAKKRLANGSSDDRYRLALAVIEVLEECHASQSHLPAWPHLPVDDHVSPSS